MLKDRMHLVPQAIIDAATSMAEAERSSIKENILERLEATRDFCDSVINAYKKDKRQQNNKRRA